MTNLRTGPNRSERRERDSETKARSCCWIKPRFNWRNGSSFEGISEADFAEFIRLARFSLGFMVIIVYSKLRFQSNNKIPNFESVYKDMNGVEGEARFRNKIFTTTRAREGCFVCERLSHSSLYGSQYCALYVGFESELSLGLVIAFMKQGYSIWKLVHIWKLFQQLLLGCFKAQTGNLKW